MKQAESPSNVKVRNVSASPSLMSNEPSNPGSWGIALSSQSSEPMYQASWPLPARDAVTARPPKQPQNAFSGMREDDVK